MDSKMVKLNGLTLGEMENEPISKKSGVFLEVAVQLLWVPLENKMKELIIFLKGSYDIAKKEHYFVYLV